MSTEPRYTFGSEGPAVTIHTLSGIYANDHSFKLSAVQKPHSPSHTRIEIASKLYSASYNGHNFINEHQCITKQCSNPGCGVDLKTALKKKCTYASPRVKSPTASPTASPRAKSRGGRRTHRNKRTRRTLRIRR